MYLTLRFWVLSFLILIPPAFAFSQEQISHIEGLECCFDVIDMTELDGELYVLATDYNDASRIYLKDEDQWILKTDHLPHNGKVILQQGFQETQDYFYVLQKDSLKYYYPLEDRWTSFSIPGEEGLFVNDTNQGSECRDDYFVNQRGVSNWVMNDDWGWELLFRDVIDQNAVKVFEEEIEMSDNCRGIALDESYFYYATQHRNGESRILSRHLETAKEDTLLTTPFIGFTRFHKLNGSVFIQKGATDFFYTDGTTENTFQLAENIENVNSSNIEYRDGKWQLLVNSRDSIVHIIELDSVGSIDEHDSIVVNTSSIGYTSFLQKTEFGKYILNVGEDIYTYELSTGQLEKVGRALIEDGVPGIIGLLQNYLIIYKDYEKIKIDLITGAEEIIETPGIDQIQKYEDKLLIISHLEDHSFQHSDQKLGALYQYSLDNGIEELLHLDEYHYGIRKGELKVAGDGLFLLDDACYEYDLKDDFFEISVPGKIQDVHMYKGKRYLLSSLDNRYNGYDSLVVLRQLVGQTYEASDILSNPIVDEPQFLDLSPSSDKLFIELRQYGYNFNSNYYDFDSYSIENLIPPGQSQALKFISKLDNGTILCKSGYSFWSFNPESEDYQLLYTLLDGESFSQQEFVELKDHHIHFLSGGSGYKVISVNKLTFEMEIILEQNNDIYYSHDLYFQCNDRVLFIPSNYSSPDSIWTTDGTLQGTHLINEQFDFTYIPGTYETNTTSSSHYINLYHSADTALYFWDCATNDFIKVFPDPLKIDHIFPFENVDWLIANIENGDRWLLKGDPGNELQTIDTLYPNQSFVPREVHLGYWDYSNPYLEVGSTKVFFRENLDDRGSELWRLHRDSGLTRITDINPGAYGSHPNNIRWFEDQIYFLAYTYGEGMQVWRLTDSVGTTSVQRVVMKPDFTVAPNPTKGEIQVYDLPKNACTLQLLDLSGKVLQRIEKQAGVKSTWMQFGKYPPGLYLLNVDENGENRGTIKIMKQ